MPAPRLLKTLEERRHILSRFMAEQIKAIDRAQAHVDDLRSFLATMIEEDMALSEQINKLSQEG